MRARDVIWLDPRAECAALEDSVYAAARVALDAAGQDRAKRASIFDLIHAHTPDCPDKLWRGANFKADANRPKAVRWKAKALGLDPDQKDMDVALSGMVPIQHEGKWLIAVAFPAPKPLSRDPHVVTDLVLIDTATNQASVAYEPGAYLIPSQSEDHFTVDADPIHWAREFATSRLEWFYMRRQAKRQANIEPPFNGAPPSALAIGDLTKIRWPHADQITAGEGIDPQRLIAAVRRQFHLPRIHTPQRSAA